MCVRVNAHDASLMQCGGNVGKPNAALRSLGKFQKKNDHNYMLYASF